jgi:N-acetylglucosamine kinase-like BadF-type ATPase
VSTYLGVDGGGSKTAFLLIDESGRILASHAAGPAYYLEVGLNGLRGMLAAGIHTVLAAAGASVGKVDFAYFGLPAYGEDSQLLDELDAIASPLLDPGNYRCGNDAVCGWAGALACQDGINIVAGTGSIAYGEYSGRSGRAGGWGELFSDEGSAYWLAREGLRIFSRMSDGRAPRAALYGLIREHFKLESDLDICAALYGKKASTRSEFATLSKLVADAANAGDAEARGLFATAATELAQMIEAVRSQLHVPDEVVLPVSYSGGVFRQRGLLLEILSGNLSNSRSSYCLVAPRLSPVAGAALYAAKLSGHPLTSSAVASLEAGCRSLS